MEPPETRGTMALPLSDSSTGGGVHVSVHVPTVMSSFSSLVQQPQTQQIANFDAKANDDVPNGRTVAVNPQFVVYTVKNGLIRVLHRHSSLRTLLRAHWEQRVTDIVFFNATAAGGSPLLASVGGPPPPTPAEPTPKTTTSSLVLWKLVQQPTEVTADILLKLSSTRTCMTQIVWHPLNANLFCLLHTHPTTHQRMVTVMETNALPTQAPTEQCPYPTWDWDPTTSTQLFGTIEAFSAQHEITHVAWSPDGRFVLSSDSAGQVVLWNTVPKPSQVCIVQPASPENPVAVTKCFFLPHNDSVPSATTTPTTPTTLPLTPCLGTATHDNSVLTVWSPVRASETGSTIAPRPLQVVSLEHESSSSSSYVLDVVCGFPTPHGAPVSSFVVQADRRHGMIWAWHLQAQWSSHGTGTTTTPQQALWLAGINYVVPFTTRYAIFSCTVFATPTHDVADEEEDDDDKEPQQRSSKQDPLFDTKLYAYQSKLVQCLTLTSTMCRPPTTVDSVTVASVAPGVKVQPLSSSPTPLAAAASVPAVTDIEYEEEDYDYDGAQDEDDDDDEAEEEDDNEKPNTADPVPATTTTTSNNPFANWLGAIAAKTSDPTTTTTTATTTTNSPPLPPPPSTATPTPPPPGTTAMPGGGTYAVPVVTAPPASDLPAPDGEPLAFLSPSDFGSPVQPSKPESETNNTKKKTSTAVTESNTKKASNNNKSGKKSNKRQPQQQQGTSGGTETPVAILKRDATPKQSPPRTPATTQTTNSNHNATWSDAMAREIRQVVKDELKTTLLPAIKSTIKETIQTSMVRPLQASLDQLTKQGVTVDQEVLSSSLAESVDPPVRAAMADCIKTVVLPTLESVTGQVLEQVSHSLEANGGSTSSNSSTAKDLSAMSVQLSTMTELVAELTREVKTLRDVQARQAATASLQGQPQQVSPNAQAPHGSGGGPAAPPVPTVEDTKTEIRRLLAEQNFEAAFTKAVSASTAELAVFCCAHANVNQVLGMPQLKLSQPIILCLMQQLGTVVANASSTTSSSPRLEVELEWLQELALSLDPENSQIKLHVPRVLHQLVASITNRMKLADPALHRPLQRLLSIVRGIPLS